MYYSEELGAVARLSRVSIYRALVAYVTHSRHFSRSKRVNLLINLEFYYSIYMYYNIMELKNKDKHIFIITE